MYSDKVFDRKQMIEFLTCLGKEYRKISKSKIQIIIVGGSSIILRYSFRINSEDIDGLFPQASDAIKTAIKRVADQKGLSDDWLNDHFKFTDSYSPNVFLYSTYWKTFSNLVEVRLVNPAHLITMKLIAGRLYKRDQSDILGILIEERARKNYISKDDIIDAFKQLYGKDYKSRFTEEISNYLDDLYNHENEWESLYYKQIDLEADVKNAVLDMFNTHVGTVTKDDIMQTIEKVKNK